MNALYALALGTPIWGFALTPPIATPAIAPQVPTQVRAVAVLDDEVPPPHDEELAAEAHNATMMDWTRGLQLVSTAAMGVAGVLGFIQLADEYGFQEDYSQTACATGDAVFSHCGEGTPWPHALAVGATAGLGLGAFALSTQVDFERAARRDADWRIYEVTRWVGFAMFVAQGVGGFLLANAVRFGWADPQRDFDTMQGFAIGHMALGAATFGLETFNTILLF